MYTSLITAGCSHSSKVYGTPWSTYLAQDINLPHHDHSSSGAGVSFYVEKLADIIPTNPNSLVVVQLTFPERLCLGLFDLDGFKGGSEDSHFINRTGVFTFTYDYIKNFENLNNFFANKNLNYSIPIQACEFLSKQVSLSEYTKSTAYQSILTAKALCDLYECELILFTWGNTVEHYFTDRYKWMVNRLNFIPGSASNFLQSNNIQPLQDNAHYGSQAHKRLYEEFIRPYIAKYFPADFP